MPTTKPEWAIYRFADNLPPAVWTGRKEDCCILVRLLEPFPEDHETKTDAGEAFAFAVMSDLIRSASKIEAMKWSRDMMLLPEGVWISGGESSYGPSAIGTDGLLITILGPNIQLIDVGGRPTFKHSHLPGDKKTRRIFLKNLFRVPGERWR